MASARDIQFFNTLFKAADIFYKNPDRTHATITWNGRAFHIFKKPALKLFRILMPQFRVEKFKDDNALVKYLYEQRKFDRNLARLTYNSDEKILTDAAHDDFAVLAGQTEEEQEKSQNQWLEKHLGERKEKPLVKVGGGGKAPTRVATLEKTEPSLEEEKKQTVTEMPQPVWTAPVKKHTYEEPAEEKEDEGGGGQISIRDLEQAAQEWPVAPKPIKD